MIFKKWKTSCVMDTKLMENNKKNKKQINLNINEYAISEKALFNKIGFGWLVLNELF